MPKAELIELLLDRGGSGKLARLVAAVVMEVAVERPPPPQVKEEKRPDAKPEIAAASV